MSVSWDRKIDNAKRRFKLLNEFNTEAVLDKETGLVWERRPRAKKQLPGQMHVSFALKRR